MASRPAAASRRRVLSVMPTREPPQLDRPRTFELFTLENTRDHTETVVEEERELLLEHIWNAVL